MLENFDYVEMRIISNVIFKTNHQIKIKVYLCILHNNLEGILTN